MSADDLRRMRDAENQARQQRMMWDRGLAGRTPLPAPASRTRTRGGVQPPSIGVVAEMGEMTSFHMRGALIADKSDPYPVMTGGAPMLVFSADAAPTAADFDIWRNASVVDTVTLSDDWMEYQVDEVYVRGDTFRIDCTDPSSAGSGLVVAVEFRASLT
jgi:hypothetical protein